jgi:hypothetical protein
MCIRLYKNRHVKAILLRKKDFFSTLLGLLAIRQVCASRAWMVRLCPPAKIRFDSLPEGIYTFENRGGQE